MVTRAGSQWISILKSLMQIKFISALYSKFSSATATAEEVRHSCAFDIVLNVQIYMRAWAWNVNKMT